MCERGYLHFGFVPKLLRSSKKKVTNCLAYTRKKKNLVLKMLSKGLQLKAKAHVEMKINNAFGDNTCDPSGP